MASKAQKDWKKGAWGRTQGCPQERKGKSAKGGVDMAKAAKKRACEIEAEAVPMPEGLPIRFPVGTSTWRVAGSELLVVLLPEGTDDSPLRCESELLVALSPSTLMEMMLG